MADPITALTPAPTITVIAPTPIAAGIHTQPPFDAIELLPPAAADKLRQLRERASDAHRLTVPYEDIRQASMARIEAENALKRLTNHPHDHGFRLKPDDRRVIAAQRTLDKTTDELRRLQERQATRSAAWNAAGRVPQACEAWLRDGRPGGTTLEAVEVEPPKLLKGEDVLSAVERLRRRVRELRADLHRLASATMPSSYAKQKMREQVGQLAARGAPSASLLVEHDGEIVWPTVQLRSEVYNAQAGAIAFAAVPDAVALVAWALKDALIKKLDAEIDSEADDAAALSHEARQKAEAEVREDLLSVERDESALVWRAMDEKLPVEHRHDCSPQAILQVQLITAPHATNGPTSPDHGYDIVLGGRR
jgi:hypothetical protein